MNNAKIATALLLASALLVMLHHARAEETEPDKFKIAIGGYAVGRYDSTMSLTEPSLGAGVSISPEDTLGLDATQTVARLDGYYRFNRKHALTYSWYRISSDGNKTVEDEDLELPWLDEDDNPIVIPVGARIDTVLDYDIFKLGYLWSFHHTDKVELAVGAGLHLTRITVGMTAETTVSGADAKDVKTTVPLPVLSFALIYNVTPKFSWHLKTEVFAIAFDDWEGTYTDGTLGMEYRAWKNVGLGVGLGSNSLKITEETNDYKFSYDNRISGINAYVAAYF
jgi:hypothetical protein